MRKCMYLIVRFLTFGSRHLMAMAAVRAGVQLLVAPSHWEKTTHGLADPTAVRSPASADIGPPDTLGVHADT